MTTNQTIFSKMYVAHLREALSNGDSMCDYFEKHIEYPTEQTLESNIPVNVEKLQLKYKGDLESAANDLDNAIALYEAFPELTEAQASEARLWTFLTHVTLREYVMLRWPLSGSCDQLQENAEAKKKVLNHILTHWFATDGNDRQLRRNAVARLWWAAKLTRSPWENDSEFFTDLKTEEDPYRFTRVLLSTQDLYQQVLERGLGRDNRMLITVLEFIEAHDAITRTGIREFLKELNLTLSVKILSMLDRTAMKEAVFAIGMRQMQNPEITAT